MPSERSSASAMTGEKAEREKARSISLQTCCKPACTTARVSASKARCPDPQIADLVHDGDRAGLDHRCRVDLLHHRRPLDARLDRQRLAGVQPSPPPKPPGARAGGPRSY